MLNLNFNTFPVPNASVTSPQNSMFFLLFNVALKQNQGSIGSKLTQSILLLRNRSISFDKRSSSSQRSSILIFLAEKPPILRVIIVLSQLPSYTSVASGYVRPYTFSLMVSPSVLVIFISGISSFCKYLFQVGGCIFRPCFSISALSDSLFARVPPCVHVRANRQSLKEHNRKCQLFRKVYVYIKRS